MNPLMSAVRLSLDNGQSGVLNPANWESGHTHAIEYTFSDRQFANVEHGVNRVYFTSEQDMDEWIARKREWVKGTDYDFSVQCVAYLWDLGPTFVKSFTI